MALAGPRLWCHGGQRGRDSGRLAVESILSLAALLVEAPLGNDIDGHASPLTRGHRSASSRWISGYSLMMAARSENAMAPDSECWSWRHRSASISRGHSRPSIKPARRARRPTSRNKHRSALRLVTDLTIRWRESSRPGLPQGGCHVLHFL